MIKTLKIDLNGRSCVIKEIHHIDLCEKDLLDIIDLKMTVWSYPKESQLNWIKKNVDNNDVHYLLYDDVNLIGYMFICSVSMVENNNKSNLYGISNVCVRKALQNKGYGSILLKNVLELYNNKPLILLTTSKNSAFYKKNGFSKFDGLLIIDGKFERDIICFYKNFELKSKEINLDRSF